MNQNPKFKRWTVLKRKNSNSASQTSDPSIYVGEWAVITESESFEIAKQCVIKEYKTVGLNNLMLCRPVDLTTVLYPIN